ncbi:ABC-F family ATP-binding cassette domain-containing protein [Sulfidibacter corallicola]|uniref:ABC-F family ATP-binding cassette domain-containing protein n=1 Tax=Sulfidibacter corallicola TaxID=2818388 RepID=A0A8A4TU37_SULCO|nr:ABC-F family ATP-binding cassette domain-containing protein [Sulfidibacter corallicola]QTD52654.1 ABC-F family ATP-binding cassette domain-containing protein [Sulfidibacter corallicola]
MINLINIVKRYGTRVLFEDVNLRFDPGKRYGIVGANGAGKSTLLRVVTGEETADGGDVTMPTRINLGTLTQDHFAFEDVPIVQVVMKGKPVLSNAFEEKEVLLDDPDSDIHRIAELEEIIADHDGYAAEARIAEMLEGLGIPTEKHYQPMKVLSGGYKLRVLLAQCLFGDPDALLLDEPTNHLDIYSIKWLEDYLNTCRAVVLVVSHDREFLNAVCTHMVDVDYGTTKLYTGNYDQFLEQKALDEEMRQIETEKREKRIDELNAFVTRFKAKASKARQASSKAKQIERMEKTIEAPRYSSRVFPRIQFTPCRPPGKQVLEIKDLGKSFGDKEVLRNVTFDVYRNDKIAILGPNGVGKSTLLKILVGELEASVGHVEWGHETYPQYFSQDHGEALDKNTSLYEWLYSFAPGETIGAIRGTLGNLLFSGDDVHKQTSALSGGEAARLVISKLVLLKGNVLILDEPTNHLDMEAIESLVEAIESFDGTVLLVSHNRYVVDRLATKILEIRPEGIDLFDGTYAEFLEKVGADYLSYQVDLRAEKKAEKREKKKKSTGDANRKKRSDNRKVFNAEAKPLKEKNKAIEAEVEGLEEQLEAIKDLFSDPNYFAKTDPAEVRGKDQEKRNLESALEAKYAAWEEINTALEALKEKHGVEE